MRRAVGTDFIPGQNATLIRLVEQQREQGATPDDLDLYIRRMDEVGWIGFKFALALMGILTVVQIGLARGWW